MNQRILPIIVLCLSGLSAVEAAPRGPAMESLVQAAASRSGSTADLELAWSSTHQTFDRAQAAGAGAVRGGLGYRDPGDCVVYSNGVCLDPVVIRNEASDPAPQTRWNTVKRGAIAGGQPGAGMFVGFMDWYHGRIVDPVAERAERYVSDPGKGKAGKFLVSAGHFLYGWIILPGALVGSLATGAVTVVGGIAGTLIGGIRALFKKSPPPGATAAG